jgi:DNA-binding ferritin-like protein
MTTLDQLQRVFCDNFLTYYHSHVAHVNIVGRNFASDHRLLKHIYQARQEEIDNLAEIIRTLDGMMIDNLQGVIVDAGHEDAPVRGTADELLSHVEIMLQDLCEQFTILGEVASEEDLEHIENYAQEQIMAINKQLWMLRSTLETLQ